MTVSLQDPINSYRYAGGMTFVYTFQLLQVGDLLVTVDGETKANGVDYTVSGIGAQAGGAVTFLTTLTTGQLVSLSRQTTLSRSTDYQTEGDFLAGSFNDDLDRLWMALQERATNDARSLRAPAGETFSTLPPAASRANLLQSYDSNGAPILVAPSTGTATALALTLASSAGAAGLGNKRSFVSAIANNEHAWHESQVIDAVADCGMSSAGTAAANTIALQVAISACVAMGGGVVEISTGIFAMTAGTNFAAANVAIVGRGKPVLDFSAGTGVGFYLASSGVGTPLYGMRVENLDIKGGPAITDAFQMRGICHSTFRKINVREATSSGFNIRFAVLNVYDTLSCTTNHQAMTTFPTQGFKLDDDGAVGNYCSANTFINCFAEGLIGKTGVVLLNATGNTFAGGSSESNAVGLDIQNDRCRKNHFIGWDFESNSVNDINVKGYNNVFESINASSLGSGNNVENISGTGTVFIGGFLRVINLQAGSSNTSLTGTAVSNSGSLGIQGTGTYTAIGVISVDGSYLTPAKLPDALGEPGQTWTPSFVSSGGGAQGAVTNAVGTHCRVGKLVYVQGFMNIAKGALNAGSISITGLPVAARNTTNDFQYLAAGEWQNITLGAGYSQLMLRIAPGTGTALLLKSGTSVASGVVNLADFPDPMRINFSGMYEAL